MIKRAWDTEAMDYGVCICGSGMHPDDFEHYRAAIEDALTTLEGISGQSVEAAKSILRTALTDDATDGG